MTDIGQLHEGDTRPPAFEQYRRSFRKTTSLALALAILSSMAAVASYIVLEFSALTVSLVIMVGLFAVVGSSGFVVLHRHRREQDGRPDLYWTLLMDIAQSPPRGVLRALFAPKIRAGTMVRVRSAEEILQVLDEKGETDGIPFMPEMLSYCGKTYPVHCVVDKINDWTGRTGTGIRRLKGFVSLRGLRCDGSGHGGCQAGCYILWHESWLARPQSRLDETAVGADARVVYANAVQRGGSVTCYKCQITELVRASRKIPHWDVRQDVRPLLYGNVDLRAFSVALLTRLFNRVQRLRGGMGFPMAPRQLTSGPTPLGEPLGLRPGEEVVALSKTEVGQTLYRNSNRGLWFGAENMRFCGQRYTVRTRVSRFIDENTGEMVEPKRPFIVLESVFATGEFLRFCPQYEFIYWRELWLERLAKSEDRQAG